MANATKRNQIDSLWDQFRDAIDAAYAESQKKDFSGDAYADSSCLRDYARNISWSDDLVKLLANEEANERDHRRNRPSPKGFSVTSAAKLILMNAACTGSQQAEMPKATIFLTFRKSAAEANLLGFLTRKQITRDWRTTLTSLDYSKLMGVSNG